MDSCKHLMKMAAVLLRGLSSTTPRSQVHEGLVPEISIYSFTTMGDESNLQIPTSSCHYFFKGIACYIIKRQPLISWGTLGILFSVYLTFTWYLFHPNLSCSLTKRSTPWILQFAFRFLLGSYQWEGTQGGREQHERGTNGHMQPPLILLSDHQPEKARDDKCMG